MANRVVDAVLRLTDNFTKPAMKSIETMVSMSKAGVRVGKDIQKVGDNIAKFGSGITTAVTLPLAGVAAASVTSFGSVDKSMRLVKETMGDTKWAAADLEGAIKTAAANSVFSMKDAADASLNFARQGWDAAQAADMLTPALNLAAGTATDLSTVTGGLGNTLKAFGADASEATKYADMMAQAQAQANTDVTGLFDAMSIAGATCNTVGWSFSDLATLTGVFGDASISASEGATALNTGLMRLASPSKEGLEAMKQLGINVFDTNGKLLEMPETISRLQEGFSGLSDQEALASASAIFGKNQASKFLTLINGPGLNTLKELKGNIEGVSGTSQDMADALLSGVGGSIEKLKSTFDVFKYSVGSVLADVVTPFIDRATSLVDCFNKMDQSQQKNIVKWAAIAAAVGPAIMIFGKTVDFVAKCIVTFNKFGKTIKAAGGIIGLLTSPVAIVIGAIVGLIAVVLIVRKNFDVFRGSLSAMSPVFNSIKSHVQSIMQKFSQLWSVVGPIAFKMADVLGVVLTAAIGGLVGNVSSFADTFASILDNIMTSLNGLVDFIAGVFTGDWERAWNGISGIFSGVVGGIEIMFKGTINGLISAINGFLGGLNGIQIPDWVPGVGGKSFSIPLIPTLAKGTENWGGGIVQVSERGGEIIDLPRGSRVYPHDKSMEIARRDGAMSVSSGASVTITGNNFYVRTESDIEKIGYAIVQKMKNASANRGGWTYSGNMA